MKVIDTAKTNNSEKWGKKRQKRTKKGKIFKNFIKSVQNVKIF